MNNLFHWEPGWDLGRWEWRHWAGGQAALRGVLRIHMQVSALCTQHFSKCPGPAVGWVNQAPKLWLHGYNFLCQQWHLVWAEVQQREWIHTGHQSRRQPPSRHSASLRWKPENVNLDKQQFWSWNQMKNQMPQKIKLGQSIGFFAII